MLIFSSVRVAMFRSWEMILDALNISNYAINYKRHRIKHRIKTWRKKREYWDTPENGSLITLLDTLQIAECFQNEDRYYFIILIVVSIVVQIAMFISFQVIYDNIALIYLNHWCGKAISLYTTIDSDYD